MFLKCNIQDVRQQRTASTQVVFVLFSSVLGCCEELLQLAVFRQPLQQLSCVINSTKKYIHMSSCCCCSHCCCFLCHNHGIVRNCTMQARALVKLGPSLLALQPTRTATRTCTSSRSSRLPTTLAAVTPCCCAATAVSTVTKPAR
jgi:hypothetical protein